MNVQELLDSVRNDVRQGAFDDGEILALCDQVEEFLAQQNKSFGDLRIGSHLVAIQPIALYEGTVISEGETFEVLDVNYNAVKDSYSATIKPLNPQLVEAISQISGIEDVLAVYINKQYNRDFEVIDSRQSGLTDDEI